jgi:tetratricopeptide (TPR) repeat protein
VPRLNETGQSHYQQEELHSALDAWRRALLIDPGNEEARAYVSRAELLLQNLERLRSEPGSAVGTQ